MNVGETQRQSTEQQTRIMDLEQEMETAASAASRSGLAAGGAGERKGTAWAGVVRRLLGSALRDV